MHSPILIRQQHMLQKNTGEYLSKGVMYKKLPHVGSVCQYDREIGG